MRYTPQVAVQMSRALIGLGLLTLPSVPRQAKAKNLLSVGVEEGGAVITFRGQTYRVDDIRRASAGPPKGSEVPAGLPQGRLLKDLLNAYLAHCLEGLAKEWPEKVWSSASRWVLTEAINGGLNQIKGSGPKRCIRRLRGQFLNYLPAQAESLEESIQTSFSLINSGSAVLVEAPPVAVRQVLAVVLGVSPAWQWLYRLYYWLRGFKNLGGSLKQLERHIIDSVAQQRWQETQERNLLVSQKQLSPSLAAVALADRAMHFWVGPSDTEKAVEGELALVAPSEERLKKKLREKLKSLGLNQEALRKELIAFCDMAHEKRLLMLLPNFLLSLPEGDGAVECLSVEDYQTFVRGWMDVHERPNRKPEINAVHPAVWPSEEGFQSMLDLTKALQVQEDLDTLRFFFEGLGLAISQEGQKVIRSDQDEIWAGFKELGAGFKKIAADQEKIAVGQEKIAAGQEKIAVGQEKIAAGQEKIAVGQEKIAADQEKRGAGFKEIGADQKKIGRLVDFMVVQQWLPRVSEEVVRAAVWSASARQISKDCVEFLKLHEQVIPLVQEVRKLSLKEVSEGAAQESHEITNLRERIDELLVTYRPVVERLLKWKEQCLENTPSQSSLSIASVDQPLASPSQTPVAMPGSVLFGSMGSRADDSAPGGDQPTPM